MSLRRVKEQVAMLRDEIGQHSGREWFTIKVPVSATDDDIAAWLASTVGPDWRRNIIVRMEDADATHPAIIGRTSCAEKPGFDGLTITIAATDAKLC